MSPAAQAPWLMRVGEPELMEDPEQVAAYALADFSAPNNSFLAHFAAAFPELPGTGSAVDLGCGPADIALGFVAAHTGWRIDAVDGSRTMLDWAERRRLQNPAGSRLQLLHLRLPEDALAPSAYQAVLSNSLLHHLADESVLWNTIARCAAPGACVQVMDLLRPQSAAQVSALVEQHAGTAPPVLRRDFHASLLAAYRLEEIRGQLEAAGLGHLQLDQVSDRHCIVHGHR